MGGPTWPTSRQKSPRVCDQWDGPSTDRNNQGGRGDAMARLAGVDGTEQALPGRGPEAAAAKANGEYGCEAAVTSQVDCDETGHISSEQIHPETRACVRGPGLGARGPGAWAWGLGQSGVYFLLPIEIFPSLFSLFSLQLSAAGPGCRHPSRWRDLQDKSGWAGGESHGRTYGE